MQNTVVSRGEKKKNHINHTRGGKEREERNTGKRETDTTKKSGRNAAAPPEPHVIISQVARDLVDFM
jgi:hypothetical protein